MTRRALCVCLLAAGPVALRSRNWNDYQHYLKNARLVEERVLPLMDLLGSGNVADRERATECSRDWTSTSISSARRRSPAEEAGRRQRATASCGRSCRPLSRAFASGLTGTNCYACAATRTTSSGWPSRRTGLVWRRPAGTVLSGSGTCRRASRCTASSTRTTCRASPFRPTANCWLASVPMFESGRRPAARSVLHRETRLVVRFAPADPLLRRRQSGVRRAVGPGDLNLYEWDVETGKDERSWKVGGAIASS